jgi:hypothetical protein
MLLPKFIELPGSSTYRHPFPLNSTNMQTFVLKASWERLRAVTDQWLNHAGSLYRFVPLPFVVCNPTWISRIGWTPQGQGWMHETDFNFGFFVAAFRDLVVFDHFAVAQAYLVVDNPITVASGREIFGFRKVFGTMEYVVDTWQPAAAATWVYKSYGPDQELELAEVARIVPPVPGAATGKAVWEDIKMLERLLATDAGLAALVKIEQLIEAIATQDLRVIQLLQVRDVEDPLSAGYQALIEFPMQIDRMHSAWLLPPGYRVQLTDYPSYPLISDLGIEVQEVDGKYMADSVLSFQVNMDCTLATGKVLHAAGRHSPLL